MKDFIKEELEQLEKFMFEDELDQKEYKYDFYRGICTVLDGLIWKLGNTEFSERLFKIEEKLSNKK